MTVLQLAERLIFQRAVVAHPGVVDQDVEPAETISHGCGHRLPMRRGSYIPGHRDHIEPRGQLLKAVCPPGRDHDIGARLAQHLREPPA